MTPAVKEKSLDLGKLYQEAFDKIKEQLSSSPVLATYDPMKETIEAADTSLYELGAVLTQTQSDRTSRAVAYASQALTGTEAKYAQVNKSLALTWDCERFVIILLVSL